MARIAVDQNIQRLLDCVKKSFSAKYGGALPEEFSIVLDDRTTITLKAGDKIDFLRAPREKCRPGDSAVGYEPRVWWRFTIDRRHGRSWPVGFEVSPDGQTLRVRTPSSCGSRMAHYQMSMGAGPLRD